MSSFPFLLLLGDVSLDKGAATKNNGNDGREKDREKTRGEREGGRERASGGGGRGRGRETARRGVLTSELHFSLASDGREEWGGGEGKIERGGREVGQQNRHLDVYFNFTVFGWHPSKRREKKREKSSQKAKCVWDEAAPWGEVIFVAARQGRQTPALFYFFFLGRSSLGKKRKRRKKKQVEKVYTVQR